MGEIELVRVDDRLIHAQILLVWLKTFNITTILLVDDSVANNPFLSEIYKLAMPSHITLHIRTVESALDYDYMSESSIWQSRRTLVLVRDLDTAQRLCETGFPVTTIQIGGGVAESGLNKQQLLDTLLERYHRQISYFISRDITVFCQASPKMARVYLNRKAP